jgi:hypothetical protein
MKSLLTAVSLALLAGTVVVQADDQYAKVVLVNKIDFPVEVSIYDKNGHDTDRMPGRITPGGIITSKAMLDDKGYVSVEVKFYYQDGEGHAHAGCWDILTSANGRSELPSQDLTADSGQSC